MALKSTLKIQLALAVFTFLNYYSSIAQDIVIDVDTFHVEGLPGVVAETPYFNVYNVGNKTIPTKWVLTESFPDTSWKSAICECIKCYDTSTYVGGVYNILPNDSCYLYKFYCHIGNTPGIGYMNLYVHEDENLANGDSVVCECKNLGISIDDQENLRKYIEMNAMASDYLYINILDRNTTGLFTITDLNGNLVKSSELVELSGNHLYVGDFSAGAYIIHFSLGENDFIAKFIKR